MANFATSLRQIPEITYFVLLLPEFQAENRPAGEYSKARSTTSAKGFGDF